ncbi:MAG: iron-containing alcohol dehydrogenase family protein [Lachnospiraceae bacterium]
MTKDKFSFGLSTKLFFGENCVLENEEVLTKLGKKAMIVTGKNSARKTGALDHVLNVFLKHGIISVLFDEVESNPSLETVRKAADIARCSGVEFVVGIGGGSPLDAAKAIAVLAGNPDMDALELFTNQFTKALPIVGIPTTSGTGSEMTPYSVILRNDVKTKVSFGNAYTYPAYAFVDPGYTYELGEKYTVSTCIDAFTHVFEGYLANRSTPVTDSFALLGIEIFGRVLKRLKTFDLDKEIRKEMSLLSVLGGIVISQAGVTIPHGMGYCYTYFKGIPHGLANGLIFEEYLKLNSEVANNKIGNAMKCMGYESVAEFIKDFKAVVGKPPVLTEEEIRLYTKQTLMQKGSIANTPYPVDEEVIYQLWKNIK